MATTTYYYSDGNVTLAASGTNNTLLLEDDGAGNFDIKHFSFVRSGNDLLIYADNGSIITLEDHYTPSSAYTFINYGTVALAKLQTISDSAAVAVATTQDATFTSNEHILAGTGNNTINASSSRIYAGDGNDTITNTNSGGNIIYAGNGDDVIYEGTDTGDDAYGGNGNDTFHSNVTATTSSTWRGDAGNDSYYVDIKTSGTLIYDDSGTNDTLYFGTGLNFENFFMYQFSGDMTILSKDTSALNVFEVTLKEQYTENIDKVVFADGTTYEIENSMDWYADDTDNEIFAAAGLYNLHGGVGNDIIHGVEYADTPATYGVHVTNWIPTLYGDEGDDIIYHGWTGIGGPASGGVSYGGTGNDTIYGTDYDETMYGGDGDDTMYGGLTISSTTHDIFYGGNGNDTMYLGDSEFKTAYGENGSDVMITGMTDVAITQNIYTQMRGGADNDVYVFSRDDVNDKISYRAHVIDDSGDYDTIALGEGFNTSNVNLTTFAITDLNAVLDYYMISVNPNFTDNVIERVSFADGSAYTWNGTSYTQLTATTRNDNPIYLTAWHDVFDSLAGDDVVYALEGDDRLLGNAGDDTFHGGDGNDTMDYSNAAAAITASLTSQYVSNDGDGGNDTLSSFENIIGSAYADSIVGSAIANVIDGGAGNDTIWSVDGDDIVHGNDGVDIIYGGTGNDTLYGDAGNDTILGEDGDDTLYGGTGADTLYGGNGTDIMYGGDGNDRLYSQGSGDTSYGEDGNDSLYGLSGVVSTMHGGNGNDTFVSYGGADIMSGDSGIDTFHSLMNATIDGGADNDRFYSYNATEGVNINTTTNVLATESAPLTQTGSIQSVEAFYLSAYDDVFVGNTVGETVVGYGGADTLHGGGGNDVLYGGDDNDTLYGDAGVDNLYGQDGDDILYGGASTDGLYGGAGADTFMFENATAFTGHDFVQDFVALDDDKIDISDLLSGYTAGVDVLTDFVQITDNGTTSYLYVDTAGTNTFGSGDLIATIYNAVGLTDESALETAGTLITA